MSEQNFEWVFLSQEWLGYCPSEASLEVICWANEQKWVNVTGYQEKNKKLDLNSIILNEKLSIIYNKAGLILQMRLAHSNF